MQFFVVVVVVVFSMRQTVRILEACKQFILTETNAHIMVLNEKAALFGLSSKD